MRAIICFTVAMLTGCLHHDDAPPQEVSGYKPVYIDRDAANINIKPSQTITNPGKIYRYGQWLFINEINRGVHVFDNTDRSNPTAVGFIEILGNSDVAIQDSVFYADHMGNLAAFKSHQFTNIEPIGSLPIQGWLLGVPPPAGHYFECVDSDNGLVASWQSVTLTNPNCYAFARNW
jgi:hypothetical protein